MVTNDFIVDIANKDGQLQLNVTDRKPVKRRQSVFPVCRPVQLISKQPRNKDNYYAALFILVAVCLLSGCLTAPPKEAAKPTLMPRAQSYRDLTHLPVPTGKIFVSVYNIQDETGQFKPYPASNFSTAVPQSATAMLVTALKDSRWFIPLERQGLQNLLNERKIIRAAQENGTVGVNNRMPLQSHRSQYHGGRLDYRLRK